MINLIPHGERLGGMPRLWENQVVLISDDLVVNSVA